MQATPVDLDLAAAGYLRAPDGRLRYIWNLDRIVTTVTSQGARLYWAIEPMASWALTYVWSRAIILDPALVDEPPWRVRAVVCEESAHVAVGRSEDRAQLHRAVVWGGLIEWEWQA